MLIKKAYKFRLEPTVEQEQKMAQFAGCVRYVWNRALALQKDLLKTGKRASYPKLCKHLTNWAVGIDVGIAKFATLSDGTEIAPCNSLRILEQQLIRLQRRLSRKIKFSNNWKKPKEKIQELYVRIANIRKDFLQKVSTQLCKNHAVIVMEDLKIASMSKSAKGTMQEPGKNVKAKSGLNKSILDQGWHAFREMISYKQLWNGGKVIFVPPQYTSQRCHMCGHTEKANRPTQEHFACVCCGYRQNADVNAAQNILAVGHTVLACGDIRWVTA